MFKIYSQFTKFGIVIFVMFVGFAGYLASYQAEQTWNLGHMLLFLLGLYCLSSGSLALNQVQEIEDDRKMPRTHRRPLVNGDMSFATGFGISLGLLVMGTIALSLVSPLSMLLGALTVLLYNGFYTLWWKHKWVFAAVPGAIPGALPVSIGFAANSNEIFRSDSVYLFLVLFLWQMPHFWALALKYQNDYAKADVPVLPAALGLQRTFYHMGLYTFVYVAVAMAAPWFVHTGWLHVLFVMPLAGKVLIEFFRFQHRQSRWLAFFMWTNVSVLIFVFVPAVEKWVALF